MRRYEFAGVVTGIPSPVELDVQLDLGFGVYSTQRVRGDWADLLDRDGVDPDRLLGLLAALTVTDPPSLLRVETLKTDTGFAARVMLPDGRDLAVVLAQQFTSVPEPAGA